MKRTLLMTAALPVALVLAGCETTGLSPNEQQNSYAALVSSWYRKSPGEASAKPMAPPISIAVAQIGEAAPDQALITRLASKPSLVRQVAPLPMNAEPANGNYRRDQRESPETYSAKIECARQLASDLGANYLLLVGGNIETFQTHTVLAPLNITIVGCFVAPSVTTHLDGKAAAAMLDVQTGRMVLMANSELKQTQTRPQFFADEQRESMSAEIRTEVLEKLADDVLSRVSSQTALQASTH